MCGATCQCIFLGLNAQRLARALTATRASVVASRRPPLPLLAALRGSWCELRVAMRLRPAWFCPANANNV